LIRYLKNCQKDFGLTVTCSEDNWIECCEAFASQGLQSTWEKQPVILHITDTSCGYHIKREALRWHAGFSNIRMDLGFNLTIRRLTYPNNVSSNGVLPIRFWFVNNGSAPCYRKFNILIKLEQDETKYIIPLTVDTRSWLLGDITHNEMVQLPVMKDGTYTLSVGSFFEDKTAMYLNIQGKKSGEYYEMGSIDVDTINRDDLKHVWENYYPEGYYPLEDPQSPDTDV